MRRGRAFSVAVGVLLLSACAPPSQALSRITPAISASTDTSPSPSTSPGGEPSSTPSATSSATPGKVPLLQITAATFHQGEVSVAYAPVGLAATGGEPPLRWSISAGALPAGLSASSGGIVSGTPTTAGAFSFTVRVDDTVGDSATVNRSIAVAPALVVTGICTATAPCAVEAGCINVCGTFARQSGGIAPFKYTFAGGYIWPSLTLSGLALTGTFTPPPVGVSLPPPFRFQVNVSDSLGATASTVAAFAVFNHISLPSLNAGQQQGGTTQTFTMSYGGGQGTATLQVLQNALPTGSTWSFDPIKKVIIITVPMPFAKAGVPPTLYLITFGLTDQAVCGPNAGQLCTTKGTLQFSV